MVAAVLDRGRSGALAVLIVISLLLSALPASAGSFASRGFDSGWDFIDPTNITWEKVKPKPGNITWENALRSITWE